MRTLKLYSVLRTNTPKQMCFIYGLYANFIVEKTVNERNFAKIKQLNY